MRVFAFRESIVMRELIFVKRVFMIFRIFYWGEVMVRYDVFERLTKERGVKVVEIAKATGIPQSTFTDWKMGRVKSMKAETILAIADYLKVSVNYLMTGKESKYTHYNHTVNHPRLKLSIENIKKGESDERINHYYKKIHSLSESDRQIINDMIERLSNGNEED